MSEYMTVVSADLFEKATQENLSITEAVELLKNEVQLRTLKSKLEYFANPETLQKVLVDGLIKHNPEAKKGSVERKVRGWLKSAERNINKKDAIELCFILKLDFKRADKFVTMVSEEGFHWRDPEEIVYIYAINNSMDYNDARALNEKIQQYIKNGREKTEVTKESFTPFIKNELEKIKSEDELIEYIRDASDRLGKYHNTAYKLFMDYLTLLQSPVNNENLPKEQIMTTRDIVKEYFNQELIPRFKQTGKKAGSEKRAMLSAMERNVLANWPDEVTLSKIKNREIDVTRKALILAFIVTDGGESEYSDCDTDEYYEMTKEELFDETCRRINTMLADCGFNKLDPRVPFDWMILYCMCVEEAYEIDERISGFLEKLFA